MYYAQDDTLKLPEHASFFVCPTKRRGKAGDLMTMHWFHASVGVPFAWESKPGICKVGPSVLGKGITPKLPPPPCGRRPPMLSGPGGLHIPLPPCPFQMDPRRVSYQTSGWEDDPFLAAYIECTSGSRDQGWVTPPKQNKMGSRREVFGISCKSVCDVVEDGVVRLSQLPSAHLKGRNPAGKWRERDAREQRSLIREGAAIDHEATY